MILLLGGVSETASVAEALASVGFTILVSTATDIPLNVGRHPNISHRAGRLTEADMIALIRERSIGAVVDATHPYAVRVRAAAVCAAAATGVCHATFIRPGVFSEVLPEEFNAATCIRRVSSHDEAAAAAFSVCRPVLLTTGSGNLEQYARESSRTGIEFFARVLPHPESIDACRRAGIPDCRIITGRGPFSVEDNRRHIREHDIGVVVTKDSGDAGGAPEKLEAARLEGCLLVVVARPQQPAVNAFEDIPALVTWLSRKRCENGR